MFATAPRRRTRLAPIALALAFALASQGAAANLRIDRDDEEAVGELMGDLMFHADLMSTLDALCPRRYPAVDWRAVVRHLPAHARTAELRDLSRRLSADAAQAMVHGSGGCATRDFAEVYTQTQREYELLRERWAWLNA
jgi:hypothetical protein